jgi:DNA-directed RNA polymerase specialized sigma24 family protein
MRHTDVETITRARQGDAAAIEAVARRALTLALRTSVATLGSREDAADVAQDVAIEALRDASLRNPELFDAWVYRITARKALRFLTSRRGRARVFIDHYNAHRPHRSLELIAPAAVGREPPVAPSGDLKRRDRLGGLIHEYLYAA